MDDWGQAKLGRLLNPKLQQKREQRMQVMMALFKQRIKQKVLENCPDM